jgi:hypothetical protein
MIVYKSNHRLITQALSTDLAEPTRHSKDRFDNSSDDREALISARDIAYNLLDSSPRVRLPRLGEVSPHIIPIIPSC